jgi:hypothetical protein
MTLFATIPSRGDDPHLLESIVKDSGISPGRFVIVRTRKDTPTPEGVHVIDDFGSINIQRWWNNGIKDCVARGARNVVVANDDIEINEGTFAALDRALHDSAATLACPGSRSEYTTSSLPAMTKLTGALWAVNATHGLLPDERYLWHFGDDDLDIRARRSFNGIFTAEVHYKHLSPGVATNTSPELLRLIEFDLRTFRNQYPIDLLHRRIIERTQGRTGHKIRRLLGTRYASCLK